MSCTCIRAARISFPQPRPRAGRTSPRENETKANIFATACWTWRPPRPWACDATRRTRRLPSCTPPLGWITWSPRPFPPSTRYIRRRRSGPTEHSAPCRSPRQTSPIASTLPCSGDRWTEGGNFASVSCLPAPAAWRTWTTRLRLRGRAGRGWDLPRSGSLSSSGLRPRRWPRRTNLARWGRWLTRVRGSSTPSSSTRGRRWIRSPPLPSLIATRPKVTGTCTN
mmetsp:Transcript_30886/g.92568  ORF Transcript_30886/g.92568 Transcript_30886/m.92568 type:complete len:224 (-) Transcript_30886:2460-3131(-)